MSLNKSLQIEIIDKCAVIRLVRPERKNPLSVKTLEGLDDRFDALDKNKDTETIIFTGSGKTFAAGADLNEVAQLDAKSATAFGLRGQNLMQKIYRSSKLTIAAIDGFCMGGGLDLALSCKIRFASKRAVFAHPGATLGIITGWGGTQLLPRLIGRKNALEMFLTTEKIDADKALRIGLISEITENPLAKALLKFGQ